MVTIGRKDWTWGVCFAAILLNVGCGGKTTDDSDLSGAAGTPTTPLPPPPACDAICRHVVGSCFPNGAIDECARDCEKMLTDFAGCAGLDTFLHCNAKARVICAEKVIIDDCYRERNELARCKSL
jgi:hypothetical protein